MARVTSDDDGLTLPRHEDPPKLPSEGWSATFGCRECGRVAACPGRGVLVQSIPKRREGLYLAGKGVHFAEFPCGDKDCRTPASMCRDSGRGNANVALAVLRSPYFQWILHSCGHEMKPTPGSYYGTEPVMRR